MNIKSQNNGHSLALSVACLIMIICCSFTFGCSNKSDEHVATDKVTSFKSSFEYLSSEIIGEETSLQKETAETDSPVQTDIVYSGAVRDYLPLEDYSLERVYSPDMIMIHFTSALVISPQDPYNIDHIRNIFIENEVSIHYIIERDGTVRCYIPENRVAWHAGKGEFIGGDKYTNMMNQYAIGIELVGIGSYSDMAIYIGKAEYDKLDPSLIGFTDEQYSSLQLLVEDICFRYAIPNDRDHIIGHEEYSSGKTDPGELFEWDRITEAIK